MSSTSVIRRSAVLATAALSCIALAVPAASAAPPAAGSPGGGDPYFPFDGNGGYQAIHYDVTIAYDPVSRHLDGTTVVTAQATQHLSSFNLDLHGLTVKSVKVDGRAANFTRAGEHELVITPKRPLRRGVPFKAEVDYAGEPTSVPGPFGSPNGWHYSVSGGAFTSGQPHTSSTWFPVNDIPADKATFQLTARVPDGWGVISNGREGKTTSEGGWTTYRWYEKTPMVSYGATVAIDRWSTVDRSTLPDGTPVVSAFAPGRNPIVRDIEARLPEVLDFFGSKFGPYPMDAAGGIYVADRGLPGQETQTRPTYSSMNLHVLVHEQAHQWFGNSVSVDQWRDICLSECVAEYAELLWREAKEGVDLDAFYRERLLTLEGDNPAEFWRHKTYDPGADDLMNAVYTKGPLAMHALRRLIGDEPFFTALRTFHALHRNGNASWLEFERHVECIAGRDLDGFFGAWFHGTTKPADEYLWPGTLHP